MTTQLPLALVPIEPRPAPVVASALADLSAELAGRLAGADASTAGWIAAAVLTIEQARVALGERTP